jgi:hypothetical protein
MSCFITSYTEDSITIKNTNLQKSFKTKLNKDKTFLFHGKYFIIKNNQVCYL